LTLRGIGGDDKRSHIFILEAVLSEFQIVNLKRAILNLHRAENLDTGERDEEMETSAARGGCGF
jgi:hypothetical protein